MHTTVTSKGQITIPKAVRDELGLRPGARVFVEADGRGGARLTSACPPENRFERFLGSAKGADGLRTDEIIRLMRGDTEA